MPDKLSKLQSYSLNKTAGDVKLIKLKDTYKKRANIDERISRIKRDQDIPLTGRANELSELRRIYFTQKKKLTALKDLKKTHITNNSEEPPVVAGIRGEAGIGKTRLVNEFLKPHPKNYVAGISDNSVMSPYSLLISMIKKYGDISNSDPKDLIKNKLKFILQDLSNYEKNKTGKRNLLGTYNLLCYLLGVTQQKDHRLKLPAAELKIHLQLAIRIFIEAAASKVNYTGEPFIIVCEDIHWIDDSSASAISYILNTLNIGSGKDAIPKIIMFLFLYRPEFKVMKEAEQKSEFTEIRLEALDYSSVQKIINSKTGKGKNAIITDPIPEATVKKLAERSEGNPLFIQEWMKMFGDKYTREELINIKKHKLKFERSDIEIPDSINLLIEKRLNRLTESELQILQYASVTGNEFSDVLLKGMAELLSNNSRIDEIINSLIESNFIQASEKVFGNEKYYRFHHDVIRKVVYDSIPDSSKKILHKTAGEVIEDLFSEKIEQYYYVLCDHFEKGGAEEKTIEYLEKAGDKARESFENERALGYYEKVNNFTFEKNSKVNSKTILKQLQVLKILGRWTESLNICNNLLNQTYFKKDLELYYQYKFYTADIYYHQSNYIKSIDGLLKLSKNLLYTSKQEKYLEILGLLCLNYYESGNPNKAEIYAKIFYELSKETESKLNLAKAFEYLGLVERLRGNFRVAISYFQKSLPLYEKSDNKYKAAILTNRIGINYSELSEFSKSLIYFEKCQRLTEKNGDIREYIHAIGNVGIAYTSMGNTHKALNIYKKRLELSKQINYVEAIASTLSCIGVCNYNEKLFDEALINYSSALTLFKKIGMKTNTASMYCNIALLHMHRGNYGEALKYIGLQMEINRSIKDKKGLCLGHINIANLYKRIKQNTEAARNYKKAIELAKIIDSKLLVAIAHYNYAELLLSAGELVEAEKNITLALEVKDNEDYKNQVFYFKLLDCAIRFNLELKKNHFELENNFLSLLASIVKETGSLLLEASDDESRAKVHYELWKMNLKLEEKNMKANTHKNIALKHFKILYKKTADIEYLNFISELS